MCFGKVNCCFNSWAYSPRTVVVGLLACLGSAAAPVARGSSEPPELEEIVVTATLRPAPVTDIPASVTVLGPSVLQAPGLRHFADVMALVPNLNWSGGTSRPRYFQLRGVGELEQYQGAPNPSVGFLIDDIDFSGVGMPATSLDLGQVEVLRGPQGTRYGANALAGRINVRSTDPRPEPELRTELTAGDDGLTGVSLVAGGAAALGGAGPAAWRFAAEHARSDGFRHNRYLSRDDTNERDEVTLRGKLRLQPRDGWEVDLAALFADLDNGFDAFAPDNSFDTLSDRPGRDAQRSIGASMRVEGDLGMARLRSTTAVASSDILYSFDGDWGNDAYWGEFAPYDYYSRYDRDRGTASQDLRLTSAGTARDDGFGWLAGVYAAKLDEDNRQRDEFAGDLLRPVLDSEYEARNLAVYGETEWRIGGGLVLATGLRVERWSADYDDSDGARFSPGDTMLGGHASLSGDLAAGSGWYVTASRGYKAGGFNIGPFVPEARRDFDPEYLWNVEAGLRHASEGGALTANVSLFHMWRESQQVATSFQLDPGDPLSYGFYTDNAARGRNAGLEGSVAWRVQPSLQLSGTVGLLHTEYVGYESGGRDLDGREQAHAPGYQYSLAAEWDAGRGWVARADLAGSDAFYFDASHDQRSDAYVLVHLRAGYVAQRWAVHAWARNVFDEPHAVRGFYFGLEPPDFADALYVQQGDPRQIGLTLRWSLQ